MPFVCGNLQVFVWAICIGWSVDTHTHTHTHSLMHSLMRHSHSYLLITTTNLPSFTHTLTLTGTHAYSQINERGPYSLKKPYILTKEPNILSEVKVNWSHTHSPTLTHSHTHANMTDSAENATPLKSNKSRHSDSSVSRGTNWNWIFDLIWICTKEFECLDLVDLGGGSISQGPILVLTSSFDKLDLTSCHLSSDFKRGRRREWQVNLTNATWQVDLTSASCQVTCQVPLVPKTQVFDPGISSGKCHMSTPKWF